MNDDLGAAWWEERYCSGEGTGGRAPSPSLLAETGGLRPGRALDAGCGPGGDSLWLAAHGWQVTAVDVSATALEQARRTAGGTGITGVAWVHGDLMAWEPEDAGFDLVTSHYVHVPGPQEVLVGRLASWVAPGGHLLVVGHDHGHGHDRPAGAEVRLEQVLSALPEDQWEVLVAEPRTHALARPDGTGTVTVEDVVVHARRRA